MSSTSSTTVISFGILGPLEVTIDGQPVDIGGPKQRAVLGLLLLDANRVVALDRLVDQLWEEQPPPSATGSLQAYISNLRRILEPGRPAGARSTVLVSRAPGYLLAAEPERIDANRFERMLGEGRRLMEDGRPRAARSVLHDALSLWRGPALADFTFEGWARAECARLEELRWIALETQIEARLAVGDHGGAIAQIEGLLAQQPLRERLWAQLMLALYRGGRQADALAAFRRARDVLSDQLGLDPGPELTAMEEQILRQAPSLDWVPPLDEIAAAGSDAAMDQSPAVVPQDGFVGRETQLAALRAMVDDATSGNARITLILGDAGIGKSRLAREAAAYAVSSGAHVAWGRSHDGGGVPPMWPWVQAFRDLAAVAPSLKATLPVLERPTPDAPDQAMVQDAAVRGAVFEAVAEALFTSARQRPIVLILDDLQWADGVSLQLIEFVVQQFHRASGVLMIGTYRDTEVGDDHPLMQTLGVLARADATHLRLEGLDENDVRAMIERATEADASQQLTVGVHARTGGNPFFVKELLRLVQSEGGIRIASDLLTSSVPLGVRDVVRRRLARLPEAATAVLTLAAVEGREFDFAILRAVEGMDLETLVNVIDAALITSLVEEDRALEDRYRFAHDLVRETLLERLSAPRRAGLHAALAEAYVATGADNDPMDVSRLAAHFWAASSVVDPARALPFVIKAGEHALCRLAYEEASTLFGRALGLLARIPEDPDTLRAELDLQVRVGNALAVTEGYASTAAGRAFERAQELAERLGEAATLPSLWGSWAYVCVRADFPLARQLAHHMIESGNASSHSAMLAMGHECAGISAWHLGEHDEALRHFDQALAIADTLTREDFRPILQDPRISSRSFSAAALLELGRWAEADERLNEAMALAGDDPNGRTFALLFRMWTGPYLGDRDATVAAADESIEVAQGGGFRMFEGLARAFRGWSRDDVEEVRDGIRLVEASGAMMLNSGLSALLAEAAHRTGDDQQAKRAIANAIDNMARTGERQFASQISRIARAIGVAAPDDDATREPAGHNARR